MNYAIKKINLFKKFSKLMAQKKIEWIVIGGLNNFPKQIGRDLDIILKDPKKINIVKKIYFRCLMDFKIKNIITKKDYYGNLLIAFDNKFNYYELHICHNSVRSGFFSIDPNWRSLDKKKNYFLDTNCYIFKNYFSANKKKINFLKNNKIKKPLWLSLFLYFKFKEKINVLTFLLVSIIFILTHPYKFLINSINWFKNRISQMTYKHSNVFYIPNKTVAKKVIFLVKKYFLNNYFRNIRLFENCFFIKYIHIRLYKKNFILDFLLFFKSLNRNFGNHQNSFCYTAQKPKKISYTIINNHNKKKIFNKILSGINFNN